MKSLTFRLFIVFVFNLFSNSYLLSQITFPNGNTLNLQTNKNFLYVETRILFNTGKYSPNDYNWEKISDSLDKRWFFTACFNGECRNDLLQSGSFIKDYGLNDSTCFIAFHVETYDSTGKSIIKYNVYNTKNFSDQANLTFNISYSNIVGINEDKIIEIELFPNPVSSTITLQTNIDLQNAEIKIINVLGETVLSNKISNTNNTTIDVSELNNGLYFIQINTDHKFFTKRIIKQ